MGNSSLFVKAGTKRGNIKLEGVARKKQKSTPEINGDGSTFKLISVVAVQQPCWEQ